MKLCLFKNLSFFILISIFSVDVGAIGLQEYLQEDQVTTEIKKETTNQAQTVSQSIDTLDAPESVEITPIQSSNSQVTHIIELVVAGIVASALIISLLVMFLGRWAGNKERKAIKVLRIDAEKEKEHITSAATTIREQEKESSNLVHDMRNQSTDFSSQRELIQKHGKEILESSKVIKNKEVELSQVSETVTNRINDIKIHWDAQLSDTLAIIRDLQTGLDKNLDRVGSDLEKMSQQKMLSQELLQDFLSQHHQQTEIIQGNTNFSETINKTLEETLKESRQLAKTLKSHQASAEKSLKQFNSELTHYEEQAYEQFDTTFQVADLARQELTANIDESRKHIETMRRHEEQSHTLNSQTQKNLEALDYSKIVKISNTLDSTQDMFTDIRSRVDDAKHLLDELKDIETDIRNTANNVTEDVKPKKVEMPLEENVYKMASGGDSTPVSFFSNIKGNNKKKD